MFGVFVVGLEINDGIVEEEWETQGGLPLGLLAAVFVHFGGVGLALDFHL